MAVQWYCCMAIAAPIADAVIHWLLCLTGFNTRKANMVIGLVTLYMFVAGWLYITNHFVSWAPAWIATGICFWVGWHRLLTSQYYYGMPVIPTPDFFEKGRVVQVLGCYEIPDWRNRHLNPDHETLSDQPYKYEGEQFAVVVSESSGADPRFVVMDKPYAPGYYLATWDGKQWNLQPTRKPNTRPTTTH